VFGYAVYARRQIREDDRWRLVPIVESEVLSAAIAADVEQARE
jgi:hypothetical protein